MKYVINDNLEMDSINKRIPITIECTDFEPLNLYLDFDDVPHPHIAQTIEELEYLLRINGWSIKNT